MYTIFFTINCVEQLTFSTTFVEHLIFKQLIFFCLKVKLLEIHVQQMIFHDFWFSSNWQEKILLLQRCRAIIKLCRADFLKNRISSRWSYEATERKSIQLNETKLSLKEWVRSVKYIFVDFTHFCAILHGSSSSYPIFNFCKKHTNSFISLNKLNFENFHECK
jgi:hypothetical protein